MFGWRRRVESRLCVLEAHADEAVAAINGVIIGLAAAVGTDEEFAARVRTAADLLTNTSFPGVIVADRETSLRGAATAAAILLAAADAMDLARQRDGHVVAAPQVVQ